MSKSRFWTCLALLLAVGSVASAQVCLTQSVDNQTIVGGTSVACNAGGITTDNSWYRVYDLDGDHGIGSFTPTEVPYGIETAAGSVDVTVSLYAVPNGTDISVTPLPAPLCSTSFQQTDGDLFLDSVAVGGCSTVDGSVSDLVVEYAATEDCFTDLTCTSLFLGANSSGETDPGYLASVLCGLPMPLTLDALGFPNSDIILDVCGTTAAACCTDEPGVASDCIETTQADCEGDGGLFLPGLTCDQVDDCLPLAVELDSFTAKQTPTGVMIRWTTSIEIDTVGFRLVRESGGREKGRFVVADWIAAAGQGTAGASYEFVDRDRTASQNVRYYLVDVDTRGRTTEHGPFDVEPADTGLRLGPASRR